MPIPQLLIDLVSVLMLFASPAALMSLVLAGVSLGREGAAAYEIGGGFTKWIVWTVVFLTLPQILSWFGSFGLPSVSSGAVSSGWLASFENDVVQVLSTLVLQRIVPTLAAFFLLRGILGAVSGGYALPSILAAMFLLAVQSTCLLLQSYNTGTRFAMVDMLDSVWNHIVGTIMPITAVLALVGAILNFATRKPFVRLIAVSLAMLTVSATWKLVLSMM